MQETLPRAAFRWVAGAGLLMATAALTLGCSSELASYDDTHVPEGVPQNYPITVTERPASLVFDARGGNLQGADARRVEGFGRQVAGRAPTPVTVAYPAGSKAARQAANQAAAILVQQGVARQSIVLTPRDGGGNDVTLTYVSKVAETKPCGDFSENMRGNQFNTSGPNFGCAYQQNVAAMVANPEDLQRPQPMTPAAAAAQRPALDNYDSGKWQVPTSDSTTSSSSSSSF